MNPYPPSSGTDMEQKECANVDCLGPWPCQCNCRSVYIINIQNLSKTFTRFMQDYARLLLINNTTIKRISIARFKSYTMTPTQSICGVFPAKNTTGGTYTIVPSMKHGPWNLRCLETSPCGPLNLVSTLPRSEACSRS